MIGTSNNFGRASSIKRLKSQTVDSTKQCLTMHILDKRMLTIDPRTFNNVHPLFTVSIKNHFHSNSVKHKNVQRFQAHCTNAIESCEVQFKNVLKLAN